MEISLDRQKHPPYTPTHQKQCLINQFNGSVAASITSAFGFAVSEACAKLTELGLDHFDDSSFMKNFDDNLMKIFMEYLKQAKGNKND